ncbi:peptidoglycan-binding protein [Kitasatospora sp. NBC_01560]|uniref:peptidoglycan-binding protein n=1 Tax=Kitasatospora sp. NBC_01560 TaxID=2975965 RepID=UPI00386E5F56
MPPSPHSFSDAELDELLLSDSARHAATRELTRRYGDLVLAYAGTLCATAKEAQTLAAAVFDRSLDASRRGQLPGPPWVCLLLGEARLLAAGWAAAGRGGDLSPDFRIWLSVRRAPHQGFREVVAVAEENSPLLGALGQLPDDPASELWRALAPDTGAAPTSSATAPAVPAEARTALADAYVRVHAVGAPERRCRHLAALLAESATARTPAPVELASHLSRCDRCRRALADLRAVHRWEAGHLRDALLVRFRPATVARPTSPPASEPVPPQPGRSQPARPGGPPPPEEPSDGIVLGGTHRRTRPKHGTARRRLAIGAAGVGTVALALGLAMAETPPGDVTGSASSGGASATTADVVAPAPAPPSTTQPTPARESPPARPTPAPSRVRATTPAPTPTRSALPPAPSAEGPTAAVPGPPGASGASGVPVAPAPPVVPTPTASPSATASPATPGLRRGDSGPEVVALQRLLVRAGCVPPESAFVRGRFDAVTERALAGFQQAAGIRGEERDLALYGARSRAALEQSPAGDRCGGPPPRR